MEKKILNVSSNFVLDYFIVALMKLNNLFLKSLTCGKELKVFRKLREDILAFFSREQCMCNLDDWQDN